MTSFDQDALDASLSLIVRTGATEVEFGYLEDDVPVEEADWYAQAKYSGTRLMAEHHRGPVEALEALARRLLDGGTCTHCARPIRLIDKGKGCRWRRIGARWERGCAAQVPEGKRKLSAPKGQPWKARRVK